MNHNSSDSALSREAIAQRDIGATTVSASVKYGMICVFILTLTVPPIAQLIAKVSGRAGGNGPGVFAFVAPITQVRRAFDAADGEPWDRIMSANDRWNSAIETFERNLEAQSLLTTTLPGLMRDLLVRIGGTGSEDAEIGCGGWLHLRQDIDYLTGPGFLEHVQQQNRGLAADPNVDTQHSDSRVAIQEFHQLLHERGIQLIVMPVPVKTAVYPEHLSSRFTGGRTVLENPSFAQWKHDLKTTGVLVFDPGPLFLKQMENGTSQALYLRTDSHWSPFAVKLVAESLQELVQHYAPAPLSSEIRFGSQLTDITNHGDLARMLQLSSAMPDYPPETVTIRQLIDDTAIRPRPDPGDDVLILGDSFTNIYSAPQLKWGTGGGLAEQLSLQLQRPVDQLAMNGGGATEVRAALARDLAQGRDWLAGKRVVIWQFAARELASGNWKRIPLPLASPPLLTSDDARRELLLVRGVVQDIAGLPASHNLPYPDAIISLQLVNVTCSQETMPTEVIVYLWGLKDRKRVPTAQITADQDVTLNLVPWEEVRDRLERFNRVELDDPDFRLMDLPIFWAELDQ